MTKLCPRGKAAAKRKFKVYPSAYANAYASKICAGKIKDPSGVKRKDFRGPKPMKQGDLVNMKKYGSGALSKVQPKRTDEVVGDPFLEKQKNLDYFIPRGIGEEFTSEMPKMRGTVPTGFGSPQDIKSGGLAKQGKFKYVKGGFEESNYQDYVEELIK